MGVISDLRPLQATASFPTAARPLLSLLLAQQNLPGPH
jgi:hypothetical protein